MKKIRWLKAEWPLPISEISSTLLAHQYNDANGHGFLLSAADKFKIAGSYIEKTTNISIVTDPFGNQLESTDVKYYTARFYIDSSSNVLELIAPPRSIRKLLVTFHGVLGIGLELSEIEIDPLIWLNLIEEVYGKLLVQNISSSGITVPPNGLARVSVAGKKDIRQEFSLLTGNKFCTIDNIKASGTIENCHVSFELSKNGATKISGQLFDGLQKTLKKCLEKAIQ